MAIIQISKIQQRSGELVDLPQLDEAELGFASDAKRLFIGKEDPAENIEVLTSYSNISFSQLDGAKGNLDIDPDNVANGQVLTYDGNNWVNRGGDAGGLITLGNVSNVKLNGGSLGFILETDGTGNLSWTTKGTVTGNILNVSSNNPGVVTTTSDNFFVNGSAVTITNVTGMTQLNGQTYYAKVLTSNSFALYQDVSLATPINTSAFTPFPYTTASGSNSVASSITLANTSAFANNNPITFVGNTNSSNSSVYANTVYYVKAIVNATTITLSDSIYPNGVAGPTYSVGTATFTGVEAFTPGGRCLSPIGGASTATAGGSSTSIQYNNSGLLDGSLNLTYNDVTQQLVLLGTANITDVNIGNSITAQQFTSNVSTGTAPLVVNSTTVVTNLNADLLDGYNSSILPNVSTVAVRDSSGNVRAVNFTATSNITGDSLSITSNANVGTLYTTDISTGSNVTAGNITGNWTLTSGSRLQATYADLAEYYAADKHYPAGTVLDFAGEQEVTKAGIESNKIAGVVSADPAYVMNGMINCEHPVAIALQGRVPCKVKGNVRKGDMMVSAGDGFAKAATSEPKMGTVIGKALANFHGDEGVIEVVVGRL
jgi:hypothetical protein